MTVLPDTWWKEHQTCMQPFVDHKVRIEDGRGILSYGLSSFGYDVRLGTMFLVETSERTHADPLNGEASYRRIFASDTFTLLPQHRVLAQTYETVHVPPDVLGIVYGKSTYARLGLIVATTPLEPGWKGVITLSLINPTQRPILLYVMQGIAQVVFFQGTTPPQATYQGAYQEATTPQPPRVGTQYEVPYGNG